MIGFYNYFNDQENIRIHLKSKKSYPKQRKPIDMNLLIGHSKFNPLQLNKCGFVKLQTCSFAKLV